MDASAGKEESRKCGWVALLLLLLGFVGVNGMHRFYLGRVRTGVLQPVTLGGLGLWQLADAVLPALEMMRDVDGKKGDTGAPRTIGELLPPPANKTISRGNVKTPCAVETQGVL